MALKHNKLSNRSKGTYIGLIIRTDCLMESSKTTEYLVWSGSTPQQIKTRVLQSYSGVPLEVLLYGLNLVFKIIFRYDEFQHGPMKWNLQWNLSKQNLLGTRNLSKQNLLGTRNLSKQNLLGTIFCVRNKQVFSLCTSYFGTLFNIWFVQDSDFFMVRYRPVSATRSLVLCVCFVDRCLSFCIFSVCHCVVCSSSIYRFWLPLLYLQTLLIMMDKLYPVRASNIINY